MRIRSPGSRCSGSRRDDLDAAPRRSGGASRRRRSTASLAPGCSGAGRDRRRGLRATSRDAAARRRAVPRSPTRVASPAVRAASEWAAGSPRRSRTISRRLPAPGRGTRSDGARSERRTRRRRRQLALAEAQLAWGDRRGRAAELASAHTTFERLGAQLDARRRGPARDGADTGAYGRADPDLPVHGHRQLDLADRGDRRRGVERSPPLARPDAPRDPSSITAARRSTMPATGSSSRSPTPRSAVACAIEIQRRLAEHRRAHGFAPQVRMGLHATAATQRRDRQLHGPGRPHGGPDRPRSPGRARSSRASRPSPGPRRAGLGPPRPSR